MTLRNILKNEDALTDAVEIVKALGLIVLIGVVVIFLADRTVTTTAIPTANSSASGTLTWTGNATAGNYVNFTYNSGNYNLCYIVAGETCSTNDISVVMTTGVNSSSHAANATANRINGNTTLAGILTATNSSAGVVTITYDITGSAGNNIGTTTNATNASWGATTLTGGYNLTAANAAIGGMQSNILAAGQTGSSFVVILIIAFIGGIAISYIAGVGGLRKR